MNIVQIKLEAGEKVAILSDLHLDNRQVSSRVDDLMITACDKLKDILNKCIERNVKLVLIEGDTFNRIQITHEAVNLFGEIFLQFKNNGIEVYAILGNHDIMRNSLDNFQRTPMQTLFTFGIIKHLNLDTRIIINRKILITGVDYYEYPPKAEPNAKCNILIAHMFYGQSEHIADEKHNLSKQVVENLGYDMMFLGHDHEEYPVAKCGKTLVYRHGSLLRGTAHNYNFTRKPKFLVLTDLDNVNENTVEEVIVAHRDYTDIASSYVLNKKTMSSIAGLQDVLSNLAEKLAEGSETDGDRILDIINTDEELPTECRALLLKYIQENG